MLKRTIFMAAVVLAAVAVSVSGPTSARAQSPVNLDNGGHCLAPGSGSDSAPTALVAQASLTRWIASSFVSTRWMLAGNPVLSSFAHFNLGARTRWVW